MGERFCVYVGSLVKRIRLVSGSARTLHLLTMKYGIWLTTAKMLVKRTFW